MVTVAWQTERLHFTPLAEDDREGCWRHRGVPEVSRWMGADTRTRELFDAWFDQRLARMESGTLLAFAVRHEGLIIGDSALTLRDAPSVAGRTGEREASIGYAFHPEAEGRGFATETCRGLLRHGFDEVGLRRITAEVFGGHAASSHILAKVGMRLEGIFRAQVYSREGTWFDDEHWALLAEEWVAIR